MKYLPSYSLYLSILAFILLCGISTALPASGITGPPTPYSNVRPLVDRDRRVPGSHPPVASSNTPRSISHKRMYRFSQPRLKMQMIHYQAICAIAPVQQAAKWLEDFYSSVAHLAATEWALTPETDNFAIALGHFRLSFNCVGDTIPWHFVKQMADMLLSTAVAGFAELFEVIYTSPNGQIGVRVVLDLIDDSGGSSSSDNDFWREGSVPSVNGP